MERTTLSAGERAAAAAGVQDPEVQAKRLAARKSITAITDIPGGFLAGTGASVMSVYEEVKLDGSQNSGGNQTDGGSGGGGGGGGGALEDEGFDGVVIAKVGGYAATRFVPLSEGCGGRVRSLALAPGRESVVCMPQVGPLSLLNSLAGAGEVMDDEGEGQTAGPSFSHHMFTRLNSSVSSFHRQAVQ